MRFSCAIFASNALSLPLNVARSDTSHPSGLDKDTLLFSDPEILRELYSAIEGIDVPKDAIVSINTLSEALFMKKINDLSFTIDNRIVVLIEHQSTISQNIPLRILMYIARVYEKTVKEENVYHKKLVKIPTPEFIVLYNGKEDCPDYQQMRLSS